VDCKVQVILKLRKKNSSDLLKIIGLVRSQLRPRTTPLSGKAGAFKCCTTKCEIGIQNNCIDRRILCQIWKKQLLNSIENGIIFLLFYFLFISRKWYFIYLLPGHLFLRKLIFQNKIICIYNNYWSKILTMFKGI